MSSDSAARRPAPRGWWVMAFLSLAIAGYAVTLQFRGLEAFGPNLRESFSQRPWAIWTHMMLGAVALVSGVLNFRHAIRRSRPVLHRRIGEAYVLSALGAGLAGGWLAMFAYGGLSNRLGFGGLAIATVVSTFAAWRFAVRRDLARHRQWMLRSYALILAAVSLRLQMPFLANWFRGFDPAYAIVAWSCWVPNLLAAEWIARRSRYPG